MSTGPNHEQLDDIYTVVPQLSLVTNLKRMWRSGGCPGLLRGGASRVADYCDGFAWPDIGVGHQEMLVKGAAVTAAQLPAVIIIVPQLCDGARRSSKQRFPGQDALDLPRDGHAVSNKCEHLSVAEIRILRYIS